MLADSPQDYFDQTQLMNRLTGRQKETVDDYFTDRSATMKKRQEATESLQTLTESQEALKSSKTEIQKKLGTARELLSRLTAEEKARLAAIEKKKQEEARRQAEELARQQEAARQKQAAQESSSSTTTGGSSGSSTTVPSNGTKAEKALAYARAQVGKPYVWGATGPDSYDCSGLTQAAWKAAGVSLPRTTYDQVDAGTTVPLADAQPGDLIFFYDDISHVGIYIGDGMMIHAPKPGAYVRRSPSTTTAPPSSTAWCAPPEAGPPARRAVRARGVVFGIPARVPRTQRGCASLASGACQAPPRSAPGGRSVHPPPGPP